MQRPNGDRLFKTGFLKAVPGQYRPGATLIADRACLALEATGHMRIRPVPGWWGVPLAL